ANAGVAANAGGDVDRRMWIRRPFWVEKGRREIRRYGFVFAGLRFGFAHLLDHAATAASRVGDHQGEADEEDKEKKAKPARRRHCAVTDLQTAAKTDQEKKRE